MKIQFTDQNFEEQVLKNVLPVVVDFRADWCVAPETKILLKNGDQISASQIIVGQKLSGLNNNSLDTGIVAKSMLSKDLGHCKKIVLNTGREIDITDDHLFYGLHGWTAAKDFKIGEKLAVLPSPDAVLENISGAKDLILARLAGLLFTDGTLYYQEKNHYWEVSFTLGQQKDVDDLDNDLRFLGFTNIRVAELTKQQEISARKFTTHVYKVKCLSKELFNLMKTSGVPVGAKKSQEYSVPLWIIDGSIAMKREFLRGFLGGDGPKVDIRMVNRKNRLPYNHVNINDLEFHKNANLEKSGLQLAEEISGLLNSFGVTVGKIFAEKDHYKRQDGQNSSIIHISFKKDFETALNLVSKIGYAYCHQKERTSQVVGEFLRQIFVLRARWQDLYKKSLDLATSGLGYRRISQTLGIHPSQTYGWIKGGVKARVAQHKIKFDEWLKEALSGAPSGLIWEEIEKIEPVFLPAVAKITVDQTNSFIANGILSHNCGPCKLLDPILEELAGEYEDKVVIGILDVDDNQQTASKYSVMSIPTVLFFKNGQVVKQMVGFRGKEAVVREINAIIQ